jgi:hypothetical protein
VTATVTPEPAATRDMAQRLVDPGPRPPHRLGRQRG